MMLVITTNIIWFGFKFFIRFFENKSLVIFVSICISIINLVYRVGTKNGSFGTIHIDIE